MAEMAGRGCGDGGGGDDGGADDGMTVEAMPTAISWQHLTMAMSINENGTGEMALLGISDRDAVIVVKVSAPSPPPLAPQTPATGTCKSTGEQEQQGGRVGQTLKVKRTATVMEMTAEAV